ncbi:MAG: FAD-dependent oxidoreductase [Actinomycetota bacterium]|nr:FAD-dependent oxidoreductase [Actinomycetota bacterium]
MTQALDYLSLLKDGLPKSSDPPKSVAIVGAGIAGLTAGLLLKDAGHDVTILEAQHRIGGRILTYRGFAGNMYAELGAMRFPLQHQLGQYLIRERFKLPVEPFPMYDEDTIIHLQGKSVRRSEFSADMFDFNLPPHEADKNPLELLRATMQPLIDIMSSEDPDKAWLVLLEKYDNYSLLGYLKERGLSDAAIAMLGPLYNLEGRYHFSLVEWFLHYYEDVFGDLVYIVDGADCLPKAFEPYLLNNVRLGADVHAIQQSDTKVTVHFRDRTRNSHRVRADECIITAPLALLRHMEIEGLDPDKWYALRNSYYGRAHKIFMQFSEKWWQTKYKIDHGLTVTDLAIRNVVYPPAGQDDRIDKGVIIASYCWEQDSIPYTSMSEIDGITQVLEDLAKIHPEATDTFEFGIAKDWALDQYAGGIGPVFRAFEMSGKLYEDTIRPVHRIWFANDGCDRRHRRWIEGSLRAAIKNAYAIHTGIRNEMPWKD